MDEEKTIWQGSSSQALKFGIYVLCALFCWLIVRIFIALWHWLKVRSRVYEVTTQRIRIRSGIFNKRTDEMELYRVKDTTLLEPFWIRLFGLGNIEVTTHDASTPVLMLEGIPQAGWLREELRKSVEACRDKK